MHDGIYKKYIECEQYINEGLIRDVVPAAKKPTSREWMLKFLDDIGHPEAAFPAVHIAGTSGKGSTAMMVAEILRAAGYKVGLHTSPYLQVATEKMWFNGSYASAGEFIELVEWIRPVCEKWRSPDVPLHGLASFGVSLEYFRRKKVDIAVIETGVGGRDDITNVLGTILSVITPIGIDHTKTLGPTIESIAEHKAGIIKPGANVIAFHGPGSDVISTTAQRCNVDIAWVGGPSKVFETRMPGVFQNVNSGIAATAAHALRKRGLNITAGDMVEGIKNARLPGRMEKVGVAPDIILDGAHNYQKLSALFSEFEETNKVVVFGLLETKLSDEILDLLCGLDSKIIFTKPNVYGKPALEPDFILRALSNKMAGISDKLYYRQDAQAAMDLAYEIAQKNDKILVTGSLYLVGNARELFYSSKDILFAQTSWPYQTESDNAKG